VAYTTIPGTELIEEVAQTGAAAVTAVRGIDLDMVIGKKPGLLSDEVHRAGAIGSRPSQPEGDVR
jgi:hypothetical protein